MDQTQEELVQEAVSLVEQLNAIINKLHQHHDVSSAYDIAESSYVGRLGKSETLTLSLTKRLA